MIKIKTKTKNKGESDVKIVFTKWVNQLNEIILILYTRYKSKES